jgi:hypothetical protein
MVAKYDGELLLRALDRTAGHAALAAKGSSAVTPSMTGYMVPIHCAERTEALKGQLGSDLCAPCTEAERTLSKRTLEGGWLTIASAAPSSSSSKHEFMLATFGVSVDTASATGLALVEANPPDACTLLASSGELTFEEHLELTNATASAQLSDSTKSAHEAKLQSSEYRGKVVVVQRGGCAFIAKAKHAQAAGAAAIVIVNSATHVSRFGVEPRWKGLGIHVPVVMVTDLGGAALQAAAERGDTVRFTMSAQVQGGEGLW